MAEEAPRWSRFSVSVIISTCFSQGRFSFAASGGNRAGNGASCNPTYTCSFNLCFADEIDLGEPGSLAHHVPVLPTMNFRQICAAKSRLLAAGTAPGVVNNAFEEVVVACHGRREIPEASLIQLGEGAVSDRDSLHEEERRNHAECRKSLELEKLDHKLLMEKLHQAAQPVTQVLQRLIQPQGPSGAQVHSLGDAHSSSDALPPKEEAMAIEVVKDLGDPHLSKKDSTVLALDLAKDLGETQSLADTLNPDISDLRKKCNALVTGMELLQEKTDLMKLNTTSHLESRLAKAEEENATLKAKLKAALNKPCSKEKGGGTSTLLPPFHEREFCPEPLPGKDDEQSMLGFDNQSACVQWRHSMHDCEKNVHDKTDDGIVLGECNHNCNGDKCKMTMLSNHTQITGEPEGTWAPRKYGGGMGWSTDYQRVVYGSKKPYIDPVKANKAASMIGEDWARNRGIKWCMRVSAESSGCPVPIAYINGTKQVGWEYAKICTYENGKKMEFSVPWEGGPEKWNGTLTVKKSKCTDETVNAGSAQLWDQHPFDLATAPAGNRRVHCMPKPPGNKWDGSLTDAERKAEQADVGASKCRDEKCYKKPFAFRDSMTRYREGIFTQKGAIGLPYGYDVDPIAGGAADESCGSFCTSTDNPGGVKTVSRCCKLKSKNNRTTVWEKHQNAHGFVPRASYLDSHMQGQADRGWFGFNDTKGHPMTVNRLIPAGYLGAMKSRFRPDSRQGFIEMRYAIGLRAGLHMISTGGENTLKESIKREVKEAKPGMVCSSWVSVCSSTQGKFFRKDGKGYWDEDNGEKMDNFGDNGWYPVDCATSREVYGCWQTNGGVWSPSCDYNVGGTDNVMIKAFA